jgi:hypothetical protein
MCSANEVLNNINFQGNNFIFPQQEEHLHELSFILTPLKISSLCYKNDQKFHSENGFQNFKNSVGRSQGLQEANSVEQSGSTKN